jgi:hypothetical protein
MVESAAAQERAFVRNSKVISSETPDAVIALYIQSGDCYAFEGPSARIWQLLEQPFSATQLVAQLVREFDVAEAACRAEVDAYLAKLKREGLVEAVAAGN